MDLAKVKTSLVVSSNDLVHAKYDWSLWQKRLFVYAVSLLEKDNKDFQTMKIYVKDIIHFYNTNDGKMAYKAILDAPKHLDRAIEIPYIGEEGGLRTGFVRILQKYTIPKDLKEDNQYIEIRFNDDLKPHLLELKEKFLKYDIRNVIELQSTYSFRMFEILKSYEFRKEIEFEVEALRDILQLGDLYSKYNDFKKRIIDKAQHDLLGYCDISFTYKEVKGSKGKKIQSLVFYIQKNKPKKRPNTETDIEVEREPQREEEKDPKNSLHEILYNEFENIVVKEFGVSPFALVELLNTYEPERIRKQIRVVQRRIKKGRVENIAGLFMEAVKNDYLDVEEAKEQKKQESRKKSELLELLKIELAELDNELNEQINEVIRKLTLEKPSITGEAIEIVRQDRAGKIRLEKLGIKEPTIDDFRKDPLLRGIVKNTIISQNKGYFSEIIEKYNLRKKEIIIKQNEISKKID
jgi:plasmid replication initiation protein